MITAAAAGGERGKARDCYGYSDRFAAELHERIALLFRSSPAIRSVTVAGASGSRFPPFVDPYPPAHPRRPCAGPTGQLPVS